MRSKGILLYFLFIFLNSLSDAQEFGNMIFLSLLKDVKKFYIFSNNINPLIVYLDKDMNLKISSLECKEDNTFFLNTTIKISTHQKEDEIIYLKAFYENGIYYIIHIKKFYQKLIVTSFDKKLKFKNFTININIETFIPEVFLADNFLIVFYISNNKSITYKSINLKTLKEKVIKGAKSVLNFNILKNNGLYAILWKFENKKDYLYFSLMNKKLEGFSNIYKIYYKKDVLPYAIFNNNSFSFIINYNEILSFFILEKKFESKDLKNNEHIRYEDRETIFYDEEIIGFVDYKSNYIITFRNRIELAKNYYQDFLNIVKTDKDFNFLSTFLTKNIKGILLENYFFYFKNRLFFFILDSFENTVKYFLLY